MINKLIGGSEDISQTDKIKKMARTIIPLLMIVGIIGIIYYISSSDITPENCIVMSSDNEDLKDKQLKKIEGTIKDTNENYEKIKELTDKAITASDEAKQFASIAKESANSVNIGVLKIKNSKVGVNENDKGVNDDDKGVNENDQSVNENDQSVNDDDINQVEPYINYDFNRIYTDNIFEGFVDGIDHSKSTIIEDVISTYGECKEKSNERNCVLYYFDDDKKKCIPGEDSNSFHDHYCKNVDVNLTEVNKGCRGYKIKNIKSSDDNNNIEIKTVESSATTPGPSWIDIDGSTKSKSPADFGSYNSELGCYLKYNNYGPRANERGRKNKKMNGEIIGDEVKIRELCGERCYASKDCNYFQTWIWDNKTEGNPYSCCLYNIPEENIPKDTNNNPLIGGKGKGKLWKMKNIVNTKDGAKFKVFGVASSNAGYKKRVYKLNLINGIERQPIHEIKSRLEGKTSECRNGLNSIINDDENIKEDENISSFLNYSDKPEQIDSRTRIIILVLLIIGIIMYLC